MVVEIIRYMVWIGVNLSCCMSDGSELAQANMARAIRRSCGKPSISNPCHFETVLLTDRHKTTRNWLFIWVLGAWQRGGYAPKNGWNNTFACYCSKILSDLLDAYNEWSNETAENNTGWLKQCSLIPKVLFADLTYMKRHLGVEISSKP